MPNMATRFLILWNCRPFNPLSSIGLPVSKTRDTSGWRWCANCLTIRRREIVPRLSGAAFGAAKAADNGLLTAHWRMGDGATLSLIANLSDRDVPPISDGAEGTLIWGQRVERSVPPWAVSWRIG